MRIWKLEIREEDAVGTRVDDGTWCAQLLETGNSASVDGKAFQEDGIVIMRLDVEIVHAAIDVGGVVATEPHVAGLVGISGGRETKL